MTHSRRTRTALLALALAASCGPAPLDRGGDHVNHNTPLGRIEGTLLYDGPAPTLDSAGSPIGRVVLLLFRANAPPPPDGFASTAESVQSIPATQVFANATALPNGRVRASVPFVFPNIAAAGEYQLRAFYSNRPETQGFHPLYGVRSQPQRGDVGGGALVDPSAPVPSFVRIPVGTRVNTAGGAQWSMPESGSVTRGVTVFLGLPIAEDRPVFRVLDAPAPAGFRWEALPPRPAPGAATVAWAQQTGFLGAPSRALVFPSNLPAGSVPDDPRQLSGALPHFTLEVSLPAGDLGPATNAGVVFDPAALTFQIGPWYRERHPTLPAVQGPMGAPVALPWSFPLVLLVKLHEPDEAERAVLASPSPDPGTLARVVSAMNLPERAQPPKLLFGLMVPEAGVATLFGLRATALPTRAARVVVSPIAVELQPDGAQVPIVPRLPPAVAMALGVPGARCDEGGLPAGRYGLTLVTARGQTWSLPNDLSPFAFPPNPRTAAASQGVVVRIDRTAPAPGWVCPPSR